MSKKHVKIFYVAPIKCEVLFIKLIQTIVVQAQKLQNPSKPLNSFLPCNCNNNVTEKKHLNAPICCNERKTLLYLTNNLTSVQLVLNAHII